MVYDALFIVQARANDAMLVTSDREQEKIARKWGWNPSLYLDYIF